MLAKDKGKPKEEVTSWDGYPGGAPCNVACGLGQLNIPVAFVSCLGKDERDDELYALMQSRGVDVSAVKRIDAPTRDVYVVRTADGDRIFDSFGADTKTYCDCFISPDVLPHEAIKQAQVVVMGTLGLAYPVTADAMRQAVEVAKAAGTLVFVDVNWRPVFWDEPATALDVIKPFMNQADLVKITDEEAEWAYGIHAKEALRLPGKLLEQLPNARAVLVTAGGNGASYCVRRDGQPDITGFVPVYDVDVQDTTGAGDAFTCGLLAYMLSEKASKDNVDLLQSPDDVHAAVSFGAACGALTTLNSGAIAAQPTLDKIEALVARREG